MDLIDMDDIEIEENDVVLVVKPNFEMHFFIPDSENIAPHIKFIGAIVRKSSDVKWVKNIIEELEMQLKKKEEKNFEEVLQEDKKEIEEKIDKKKRTLKLVKSD